jgi:cobalt-precorrin 5A hydrolase
MAGDTVIVAGFGFRSAVREASLADVLARCPRGTEATLLATAEDKARTPAFARFAAAKGLPVRAIDAGLLTGQVTRTRSAASRAARGTGSVAEAAALAAAGPGARLLGPRVVSGDGMATCALAEGDGT